MRGRDQVGKIRAGPGSSTRPSAGRLRRTAAGEGGGGEQGGGEDGGGGTGDQQRDGAVGVPQQPGPHTGEEHAQAAQTLGQALASALGGGGQQAGDPRFADAVGAGGVGAIAGQQQPGGDVVAGQAQPGVGGGEEHQSGGEHHRSRQPVGHRPGGIAEQRVDDVVGDVCRDHAADGEPDVVQA